jgi:hypothetical protein
VHAFECLSPSLQARKSLITLLFDGRPFSWLRHVSLTVGILVVALMATILLPDFRSIFGVVGQYHLTQDPLY